VSSTDAQMLTLTVVQTVQALLLGVLAVQVERTRRRMDRMEREGVKVEVALRGVTLDPETLEVHPPRQADA